MQGFQLSFFTQQDRSHQRKPLGEWLIETAHQLGIRGATLFAASEGFGHDHKIHAARFFELTDQPIEITMAVTTEEADKVFEILRKEKIKIFYTKTPIEFGTTE